MTDPHAEAMARVGEAILGTPGQTGAALRRAVAALGAGAAAEPPPEALRLYLEKVARHAYTVVDADVAAVREAGYSEDEIFELTLAAALGAVRARLDTGLGALAG